MSTFETYVITSGSWDSTGSASLNLNDYQGVIYYLMGPGGVPGSWGTPIAVDLAGGSGFVNTGYFDFTNPYVIDRIDVTIGANPGDRTSLSASVFSGSPENGTHIIVYADSGDNYIYTDNVSGSERSLNGFYGPGNNNIYNTSFTQRLENIAVNAVNPPQGGVTSEFSQNVGATGFGGGGFYGGVGGTGPYGYGGGKAVDGNNPTGGYAVLSFIPKTMVESTIFEQSTLGVTGTVGATGFYLYSGVGGGGGGGGGDKSDFNCYAGGGGGSGEQRYGFANFSNTDTYHTALGGEAGVGGEGGTSTPGGTGGTTILKNIEIAGGQGGYSAFPGFDGSGGYGWYGGGRAVSDSGEAQFDGTARTYIPTNFPTNQGPDNSSNGGGIVSLNFGQGHSLGSGQSSNAGGGGGGWYSGNAAWNDEFGSSYGGTDAQGYGFGGGGGAQSIGGGVSGFGTAGYWGYILLHKFYDTPNLDYHHITLDNPPPDNTTTFNFFQFKDYKGVWFFLSGDKYVNTPFDNNVCVNTGHFLIKEDNVRTITISKDLSGYFTITITFSILNGKTQTFRMKATTPQPYMDLLFYKS